MITIFDLDGTLALTEHRQHFLKETPKNWKAFNEACVDDKPNWPVINLFQGFQYTDIVYILSGRTNDVVGQTIMWLDNYGISVTRKILKMRKPCDYRDDRIVKREMFDKIIEEQSLVYSVNLANDIIVFDDRQKVVDMWRKMGLTCCQVAPGDF